MDLKLKQLYGETRPTWDTKASLAMKIVKKIWTQPKQQSIQRSNSSLTLPTFGVNIRKVYLQVRTDLINFKELKDKELNQKIKADWIVPKNLPNGTKRERVLVYFHGGGYCFGSRKVHRPLAVTLLKSLEGTKLIIPDYGLAPEEPFPIGLLHCLSTYLNLINPVDTSAPYHPDDIFIVGDSAGAGLALSCMLWLRDNTNFPQPKGYIVMSPWIDQTVSHPSFILNRSFDYITGSVGNEETVRDQTWLNDERSMYYATHDSLLTYPLVSPVFAKNRLSDSVKLPPILLQSGDCELLRDEIITFFCKTLPNAPIRYENYADSVHDFQFIPFQRLSKTALHSCLNFIQDVLNDTFIPRKSYFVEKPKGKSAIFKEFLNPYEIVLEGQRVIASLTEEGILDLWNAMKPKIKKGLIGELEEDLKEAENDASFSFDGEKFNKSEILLNSNDSGIITKKKEKIKFYLENINLIKSKLENIKKNTITKESEDKSSSDFKKIKKNFSSVKQNLNYINLKITENQAELTILRQKLQKLHSLKSKLKSSKKKNGDEKENEKALAESKKMEVADEEVLTIEKLKLEYLKINDGLVHTRRAFVTELVYIFRLRRIHKVQNNSNFAVLNANLDEGLPEYRIVNVGFSLFGNLLDYNREKFNAAVGYIVHMTTMLSGYLGVRLPFEMHRIFLPKIDISSEFSFPDQSFPLYLTDHNLKEFIFGISMLNFNILVLCFSQGVRNIKLRESCFTLENLARCCQAVELGRDQNVPYAIEKESKNEKNVEKNSNDVKDQDNDFIEAGIGLKKNFTIDFKKLLQLQNELKLFKTDVVELGKTKVLEKLDMLCTAIELSFEEKEEEWQFVD